jgi:hypothetical protein
MRRCALVLVAWVAVHAAPAQAGWLAPLPVSPEAQVGNHSAALGPDGRMIVAWASFVGSSSSIQVAMRAPGGPLEAPQPVSAPGASVMTPKVLIDQQGNALVMWEEGSVYRWAVRPVGAAGFGPVGTVTLPTGEQPFSQLSLAAAPDGTIGAVGVTTQGSPSTIRIRVMTRAPGGNFVLHPAVDEAQSSMTTSVSVDDPDMDADAQGGLYATWTKRVSESPTTTSDIKLAIRPPGAAAFGVEGVATSVAQSGNATPEPTLRGGRSGVDAAGNLTVAYLQARDDSGGSEVRLRSRPAGGPFAPGSTPVTTVNQASGPNALAFDTNAAGTGVLAWARGSGGTVAVEACVLAAGGPCGTTQPLATGSLFAPVAAVGARGDMVVAWRRTVQAADASFARAGGVFGAVHPLGSGVQVLVPQEAIDVDALGDAAVVVENAESGGVRQMRAFVNDSAPPSLTRTAPSSGQPGESLPFGATIADAWSTFSSEWDFGDGATASGPAATHTYPNAGVFATSLTATDSEGNSATRVGTVKIADTIAPGVLSFGMTNRVFAVGARRTPLSARRVRPGTTFRFNLTEAGSAKITIQRPRPGRRLRGRCRKPSKRLRSRPRCTRWVRVGALTRRVGAGESRVKFSGRLGRKALKLGRYRAVLVATDAAGNRSSASRVRFRVVARS